MEVLVKVEDDPSSFIANHQDNWVMMKGVGDAKVAKPPASWIPPPEKTSNKEPSFKDVDNPGNWSPFSFTTKFKGKNRSRRYSQHSLPTGATVVPLNKDNEKKVHG